MAFYDLNNISSELREIISPSVAHVYKVIPVAHDAEKKLVTLATAGFNINSWSDLEFMLNKNVVFYPVEKDDLDAAILKHYGELVIDEKEIATIDEDSEVLKRLSAELIRRGTY